VDRRERFDNWQVQLEAYFRSQQAKMWTALPGQIVSYDAASMTCVVQPTIQPKWRGQNGNWANVTLPVIPDVPVHFPGGGSFALTFPLTAGDEGLIVFASRCIDAWWQNGGVQPQAELRMHDLSDAFFIPKVWSQAHKLSNVSATTAQLRTVDGLSYIEMTAGHAVNIVAPGGLNVTGATNITGTTAVTGAMTATSDITAGLGTADQVGVRTHKHSGVTTGGGSTAVPTPGT
jgi:hypothetical protein